MRKQWTEGDIFGGLYIIRESSPFGSTNLRYAATVIFKIGYDNKNLEERWNMQSCLTDGWVCPIGNTKQDVVNQLNLGEPGYRKLTKEEYIAVVNSSDQGFTDTF